MVTVIAQFSVKADKINDFLTQCQELIKHTRQETGCVSYELQQNFATPHFTSVVPVLVEYCEQAPVVQTFQKVSE